MGQKERAYPRFATGIWILGTSFAGNFKVEYNGYLTNGRGPDQNEKDNNTNKGIGGRIVVAPPLDILRLGVSYYRDRNGNVLNAEQSALGFDMEFNGSNAYVETAVILPRYEEVDISGKLLRRFQKRIGYYVMAGYTFNDQLTPFAYYDFYDPDIDIDNDAERDAVLGINYSVSPSVYLKSEIHFHSFQNVDSKNYKLYIGSIAVAF